MTLMIFMLNDVLKKSSSLWYGPVLLFIMALCVRLTPLFVKNGYIVYFINTAVLFLTVVISLLILFSAIIKIFNEQPALKNESIFYSRFGLGIFGQFTVKTIILLIFSIIFFCIVSIINWSWEFKYLLFGLSVSMFFIMMRAFGILMKTKPIYYLALLFVIISMVYPLYILPNTAYVVRSDSHKVIVYLLTYGFLYFFTAFKLFYFAWREECIGWIS